MAYDLPETRTPTPTTSVSPKTSTVGGPQRGLTANGGVGVTARNILQPAAEVNGVESAAMRFAVGKDG